MPTSTMTNNDTIHNSFRIVSYVCAPVRPNEMCQMSSFHVGNGIYVVAIRLV